MGSQSHHELTKRELEYGLVEQGRVEPLGGSGLSLGPDSRHPLLKRVGLLTGEACLPPVRSLGVEDLLLLRQRVRAVLASELPSSVLAPEGTAHEPVYYEAHVKQRQPRLVADTWSHVGGDQTQGVGRTFPLKRNTSN